MNDSLQSSRRDYSSTGGGRGHRGGGGGGRGYKGGGGKGYRSGGGRGRGVIFNPPPRTPGNRFRVMDNANATTAMVNNNNNNNNSNTNNDPHHEVLQSLLHMLIQVGTVATTTTATTTTSNDGKESSTNDSAMQQQKQQTIKNIQLLTNLICGSNSEIFLQCNDSSTTTSTTTHHPSQWWSTLGPLPTGMIHIITCFPLHTMILSTLTYSIHATVRTKIAMDTTFLSRTTQYATAMLVHDLDALLLLVLLPRNRRTIIEQRIRTMTRLRLLLRYLCQLTKIGLLDDTIGDESSYSSLTSVSMLGLLEMMVQAAGTAVTFPNRTMGNNTLDGTDGGGNTNHDMIHIAVLLSSLVLGCIPYLVSMDSTRNDWIQTTLIQPLELIITRNSNSGTTTYQSDFVPGIGKKAILLKQEQIDDMGPDYKGEDEDDDDDWGNNDDEDDDDASGQVCDTVQDLLRSVKQFWKDIDSSTPSESGNAIGSSFALLTDTPWITLKNTTEINEGQVPDGENESMMESSSAKYNDIGEKVRLQNIIPTCKSLSTLLSFRDNGLGADSSNTSPAVLVQFAKADLTGIVYGRLPIFGPPPNVDNEDDDDEGNDDDNMEATNTAVTNDRLVSYQKGYSVVDRYFIGECVRDIIVSFEPSVSDNGVERGSIKNVAEQLWSLSHLMTDDLDSDIKDKSKGMVYAILETIISLIAQCSQNPSMMTLIYLSRIVLELTRLEPAIVSPAIAIAVSNLFTDYMPTLVPIARYNLSQWFAFHLIHTDYQWPTAYWKHWEPFVIYGWNNSRGAFVRTAFEYMVSNVSNPDIIIRQCLPTDSTLGDYLVAKSLNKNNNTDHLESFIHIVKNRMMMNERPEKILEYLISEELSESITGIMDAALPLTQRTWWRTEIVVKALMERAGVEYEKIKSIVEVARSHDEMAENVVTADDIQTILVDSVKKFKDVVSGAMSKDNEALGLSDSTHGQAYLLNLVETHLFFSRTLLKVYLQTLLFESIVSVQGVFQWLLEEKSETSKGTILRWWELAIMTLHFGMMNALTTTDSSMSDDSTETQDKNKALALIQFLDPLLSYAVGQVGTHLANSSSDASTRNRFGSQKVELVEGFKFVVSQSKYLFLSQLREKTELSDAVLHDTWGESDVAGPKLALLLDTSGASEIEALRRSLDRM